MNTKNLTQEQRKIISTMEHAMFKMSSAIESLDELSKMGALSSHMFSTKKMLEDAVEQLEFDQREIWNQV
jgi:signal transduction histidine kinase